MTLLRHLIMILFTLAPLGGAALSDKGNTIPPSTSSVVSVPNCFQPPSNVDHATFTDAQLDLYGLPHRAPGESLTHWQNVVRHAAVRECRGMRGHRNHHPQGSAVLPPSPHTYDEQLSNWGGNIAISYGYTEAVGQWNVPCLTLLLHDGGASPWVGIGGDTTQGGGNLVQAGTDSYEYSDFPGHWTALYQAWIEDYPNDPVEVVAFGVNCGDTMYSSIWQDYSNGKPTKAHMYISDWSSGHYWSAYNTQAFSNGSTAEWVIERGSAYSGDLADFNWVDFTQCFAIRYGSAISPINLPHNYSTMVWNGHSLVSVGPLYPDSSDIGAHFRMNWLHSS